LPLAIFLTGANRHDSKMLEALLDGHVIAPPTEAPEDGFHICLAAKPLGRGTTRRTFRRR
jgi:hypothetical protein